MKLNTVKRDVTSSGTVEVSKAKIKATAKLFDMFADQTYANKQVAILRELVANGVDAHIANGTPDVPVEVYMPSEFDPMFKVVDHGTGMPHDFVMGPFMEYTNGSTKDQANDQIGGFGIGSKSPFAYCDQFTLRVVHDGVLSVYTMFKDEDGIPAIGLQAQTTTDEASGVEVSFPVENDDMEDFRSAAQEALQYFHPLPIIHGGEVTPPEYVHTAKDGSWGMRKNAGALGVIMGGVRYPADQHSFNWNLRNNDKLSPLLGYGIDVTLPIGAADIAMSREALSYTERTNKAVKEALEKIVDDVIATFSTLFDGHKTRWAAQQALGNELNVTGWGPRSQMMEKFAKWNGQRLEKTINLSLERDYNYKEGKWEYKIPANYPKGAQVATLTFYNSYSSFPKLKFIPFGSGGASYLEPWRYDRVFLDDMELSPKSRTAARIREYHEANPVAKPANRVPSYLILRASTTTDKKEVKKLLKFLGDPEVILLSSLPEPQRAVRTTNTAITVRPKVRMFTYTGENDRYGNRVRALNPSHAIAQVSKEIAEADQPTSGTAYVMTSFGLEQDFLDKMATGLVKWDELVFVNTSDWPKIKDSFTAFDKLFTKRFNAFKRKTNDLDTLAQKLWLRSNSRSEADSSLLTSLNDMASTAAWKNVAEDSPLKRTLAKFTTKLAPASDVEVALGKLLNVTPKKPDDWKENIAKKFNQEHPNFGLLEEVMPSWGSPWRKSAAVKLLNNIL